MCKTFRINFTLVPPVLHGGLHSPLDIHGAFDSIRHLIIEWEAIYPQIKNKADINLHSIYICKAIAALFFITYRVSSLRTLPNGTYSTPFPTLKMGQNLPPWTEVLILRLATMLSTNTWKYIPLTLKLSIKLWFFLGLFCGSSVVYEDILSTWSARVDVYISGQGSKCNLAMITVFWTPVAYFLRNKSYWISMVITSYHGNINLSAWSCAWP